jgi:hypothetical protein
MNWIVVKLSTSTQKSQRCKQMFKQSFIGPFQTFDEAVEYVGEMRENSKEVGSYSVEALQRPKARSAVNAS